MARLKCIGSSLRTVDTRIAKPPPKRADSFYLSAPWRTLMASLLKSRGRICQECGRTGCRIFGDHRHELKDGGAPLDPGNIVLLCGSCHSRKTAQVRAARMRENL
ncbi:HNH endonuclease signature motif containing protein [Gluconobacter cadivus]|uniref:HNH endonuclease n=1 Tax=Gluconobacter cadivus TaxID=2728101 RepID=A0ABR9YYI9_9PROT|nr:HNH endonuclease signature motif containing protein [Gluconobacter cadivus]MBF0889631.1 HNH endonuclease [Gluconobacter cadivus]